MQHLYKSNGRYKVQITKVYSATLNHCDEDVDKIYNVLSGMTIVSAHCNASLDILTLKLGEKNAGETAVWSLNTDARKERSKH